MKKLIFSIILASVMGTAKAYSAICDCGAPPECGHSRPPQCPLEMKTLRCEGAVNGTFEFNESLNPRAISSNQESVQFSSSSSNNPFFEGEARPQGSGNRFLVSYWFGTPYCTLRFSINSIHDRDGLGWSTNEITWQCDGHAVIGNSTCKIEL